MRFELTEALIGDMLFSMEDQDGEFLLDTRQGILVNAADDDFNREDEAEEFNAGVLPPEDDKTERYIPLPEWGPSEGFRLMERFTAVLRSPLIRQELSAALDRGKGVFRAFKDALARYPEAEKLWFRFKEREMKRELIRWYNGLREEWGMELIGGEPEDTAGMVLEDFCFREGTPADREAAAQLHRACGEAYRAGGVPGAEREAPHPTSGVNALAAGSAMRSMIAEMLTVMNQWVFPGDLCLVAETAGGEFAAYITAVYSGPSRLHIHALEVSPEYQGLGLGESLLNRLIEKADRQDIQSISIDLPAGTEAFSRVLIRESFAPSVQRYCRSKGAPAS
jgi:ribosomal protein S18 acetylase RimI-like enzyme